MKAVKLPSGSWRVSAFSHYDENGKQVRKSFTCKDPTLKGKRIVEAEAAAWAADKENHLETKRMETLAEAAEEYVALRENVLSPRTIDSYRGYIRSGLCALAGKRITSITQADVQKYINQYAKTHSPKTVRNVHGFIAVIMREYRPTFVLRTKLPKPKAPDLYIPSDEDIKKLTAAAAGTALELPIMLAAFGPMRRGEICALRTENISCNTVHVCENKVKKIVDGKNTWIIKTPKSAAGDRYIVFPDFVAELWRDKEGYITDMNPDTITKAFSILLEKAGLPHFRFHDLRHYSASIQHALGVPDVYIMQRGGWGSDKTLKQVYRHQLSDRIDEENKKINSYFENMSVHESVHEKEKSP